MKGTNKDWAFVLVVAAGVMLVVTVLLVVATVVLLPTYLPIYLPLKNLLLKGMWEH